MTREAPASSSPAAGARLALVLFLTACVACTTAKPSDLIRVESERNPTASLYRYKTYAWVWEPTPDPGTQRTGEDIRDWRVRNAVEAQLADGGYTKVSRQKADLLVDYHTERKQRSVSTFNDYLKYRDHGGKGSISEVYVVGYEEAVLILEIFDGQSRQLAWRATATSVFNPGDQEERTADAVRRIFARFPAR